VLVMMPAALASLIVRKEWRYARRQPGDGPTPLRGDGFADAFSKG
jgi:hypothetical protein